MQKNVWCYSCHMAEFVFGYTKIYKKVIGRFFFLITFGVVNEIGTIN
jgi:hypothetical protein